MKLYQGLFLFNLHRSILRKVCGMYESHKHSEGLDNTFLPWQGEVLKSDRSLGRAVIACEMVYLDHGLLRIQLLQVGVFY